ncbi:MAG: hypothetical protein HFH68_06715 [Lachnospiraceae bacterium]|nr:hypothetical protein [Lachnospiraceae bacterium]
MAKQRQVNTCISKDNISLDTLVKLLQQMHIETLEEIIKKLDWTESQIEDLLTEMQKICGQGRECI